MRQEQRHCPLCRKDCQAYVHGPLRHYVCAGCGEFVISDVAERFLLRNATEAQIARFRLLARESTEDAMLRIRRSQATEREPAHLYPEILPLRAALSR